MSTAAKADTWIDLELDAFARTLCSSMNDAVCCKTTIYNTGEETRKTLMLASQYIHHTRTPHAQSVVCICIILPSLKIYNIHKAYNAHRGSRKLVRTRGHRDEKRKKKKKKKERSAARGCAYPRPKLYKSEPIALHYTS